MSEHVFGWAFVAADAADAAADVADVADVAAVENRSQDGVGSWAGRQSAFHSR